MNHPRIALVTTCKGRVAHLQRTLPKNIWDNYGYQNCKFVVLDYSSQDNLLDFLKQNYQSIIDEGRLAVYSYTEQIPFRMSHAKNLAHRLGILEGADILVNIDADNYTQPGFAGYLAQQFQTPNVFLWARMIHHGGDAPRCAKPCRDSVCVLPSGHPGSCSVKRLVRGIQGRIAVTTQAFLKSGGYDEKYNEWGPDDKDFTYRLQRLGYTPVEIDNFFLGGGIYHEDDIRFSEYPHVADDPQDYERFQQIVFKDSTIANYGTFGCGIVYKNFDFTTPIELKRLPTRIFGIGMHKTGTTSLHQALQILGFDSAHWTGPWWAKKVWEEMDSLGRSRTAEAEYAMSDLPFTLLYRQLDVAYPGSKFILTVRDEGKWVESVKNHWSAANAYRSSWDDDCFTHRIHKLVYGRKEFDADVFLARYKRHNTEVREYFRNRPDDLLVMRMDEGAGWSELCGFLGRPVPNVYYPRSFQTKVYLGEGI